MRRALALHAAQAGPALVLAVESPEVSLASLVTLATRLPLPTCCVLGILPGEAAWPAVAASGAVQTSLWPFSHADLVAFTARASGLAEADMEATTVPRPLRRTPGSASPPHPDDSPGHLPGDASGDQGRHRSAGPANAGPPALRDTVAARALFEPTQLRPRTTALLWGVTGLVRRPP
jgi:hypothetical protein